MKHITLVASSLLLFLAVIISAQVFTKDPSEAIASVELGLSEMSPRGIAGGFAIPASGSSVLTWRQAGGQQWSGANAQLPDDRAVDLRWVSNRGVGAGISNCRFTSGFLAPSGVQAISDISLGSPVARHLSDAPGRASTYILTCRDDDHGTNLTDSVALTLGPDSGEPECSDGIDNNDVEDTYIDEGDPGCWSVTGDPTSYDPDDDDESDDGTYNPIAAGPFNMTFEACKDNGSVCVSHPGTLKIDETDEVVLNWTSDADECSAITGPFNTPSGSPANASDVPTDEPEVGERNVQHMIGCVKDDDTIVKYVFVDHPAIELIPYPQPPIIPGGGMPPSDPATVTPEINEYKTTLCYLSGPGLADNTTIQSLMNSGRLPGGKYDVDDDINLKGETTFTLACYADFNDDDVADSGTPVTDTAVFKVLPVIQET